jgi:hypothetical protein
MRRPLVVTGAMAEKATTAQPLPTDAPQVLEMKRMLAIEYGKLNHGRLEYREKLTVSNRGTLPLDRCGVSQPERERGAGGLTREVETPLPSNHPRCDQLMPLQLNTIYRAMLDSAMAGWAGRFSLPLSPTTLSPSHFCPSPAHKPTPLTPHRPHHDGRCQRQCWS